MDDSLYEKILEDLKAVQSLKVFAPMLQNEPLLDPSIDQRIKLAREILGHNVTLGIVTNGSLLNTNVLNAIVDAGIDRIEVSIDATTIETFRKIRQGISFEKVIANTERIAVKYPNIDVVARFLCQKENYGQEGAFKHYWQSKGVAALFTPAVNRTGHLQNYENISRPDKRFSLRNCKSILWRSVVRRYLGVKDPVPCILPFNWLYVLVDGSVLLCCHDWGPIDVVGNLGEMSIKEIWNGRKLNGYRHLLWKGEGRKSNVCRDCSVIEGCH